MRTILPGGGIRTADRITDPDVAENAGEIEMGAKLYRLTYNNSSMSEGSLQLLISGDYASTLSYPGGNEWLMFYDASSGMVEPGYCAFFMSGDPWSGGAGQKGDKGSIVFYDSNWAVVARVICIRNYE